MKKGRDRFSKNLHYLCLIGVISLGLMTIVGTNGGGGGGGGTTTTTTGDTTPIAPTSYKLTPQGFYETGFSMSFSLTGADNLGYTYTGLYSIATKELTLFTDGNYYTTVQVLFRMTNTTTGISTSSIGTIYYNERNEPVLRYSEQTGTWFEPVTIHLLPDTAEIGDFGSLTSWAGSDGTTMTGTWLLQEASGGLANLIENITYSFGIEEATLTIDEEGDVKSIKWKINYTTGSLAGIEINLSGTRSREIATKDIESEISSDDELLDIILLPMY